MEQEKMSSKVSRLMDELRQSLEHSLIEEALQSSQAPTTTVYLISLSNIVGISLSYMDHLISALQLLEDSRQQSLTSKTCPEVVKDTVSRDMFEEFTMPLDITYEN